MLNSPLRLPMCHFKPTQICEGYQFVTVAKKHPPIHPFSQHYNLVCTSRREMATPSSDLWVKFLGQYMDSLGQPAAFRTHHSLEGFLGGARTGTDTALLLLRSRYPGWCLG